MIAQRHSSGGLLSDSAIRREFSPLFAAAQKYFGSWGLICRRYRSEFVLCPQQMEETGAEAEGIRNGLNGSNKWPKKQSAIS
jgi:hypothetical protein